jgi:hypothetical protein
MSSGTSASAQWGELTLDEPVELFLQNGMHVDARI